MTEEEILDNLKQIALNKEAGLYGGVKKNRERAVEIDLPDTQDLTELARAAIPDLVRKAVLMAHESESLGAVLAVVKELIDRAHGKPHQAVQVDQKTTVGISDPLLDLLRQINEGGQVGIRIAEIEDGRTVN